MTIGTIIAISTQIITFIGVLLPVYKMIKRMTKTVRLISDGARCQLRSEMLSTYYTHKADKKIREYEEENFIKCYDAYKALGGNSFIDRVYEEVLTWEVIQ